MEDMAEFKDVLRQSKHIIAVAGAGLSAASGVGTFRGAGGLWRKYDAMSLATPQAFKNNPVRVWKFYHYRREVARKAQPNAAHSALSSLAFSSIRSKIIPDADFTFITQNVDNLTPRAMAQTSESLSEEERKDQAEIIEMHGRLFDVKCTVCDWVEFNTSSPICEALRDTEDLIGDDENDTEIELAALPRCGKCHGLARPGVVWFGESIPALRRINKVVAKADLCLVVGTSSTVYPAAGIAHEVKDNGGKVAVFNIERTPGDEEADFRFLGPCEDTLPRALGLTP